MLSAVVHSLTPEDVNGVEMLQSDLAAEFPLYIYHPDHAEYLLYSRSIQLLLDDPMVKKPLATSDDGVSFLLQNGVIPPPKTIYRDIYVLGIGDKAMVRTDGRKIGLEFSHDFPFRNVERLSSEEMTPDEDQILQLVAEATISRVDPSRPTFLFHSAGKDSNIIALALAKAGWQGKVTLVTHKSSGEKDESAISERISKKLGFEHRILRSTVNLDGSHKRRIENFFVESPFPSCDAATFAYLDHLGQVPELRDSNIIDGGGNDSYMMAPPSHRELMLLRLSEIGVVAKFMRSFVKSEGLLNAALREPAERWGLSGFSSRDASKIFASNHEVIPYWRDISRKWKISDVVEFKTDVLTTIVAAESHIRKIRNFADCVGSNLVLPFANESVADYFSRLPEGDLFDRRSGKNKLVLRKLLKKRIGLDSDAIGKKGFSYDYRALMKENWDWFMDEIRSCRLWDKAGLEMVLPRLERAVLNGHRRAFMAEHLIYRLYLVSAWFNHNKYVNEGQ